MPTQIQKLSIADIGYEPKYYPRVNGREDWHTVHIYKEALVADPRRADPKSHPDIAFPPVHVVKASPKVWKKTQFPYLLIDGLHRIRAFHAADLTEICGVVESLPESKWFARSVELNASSKRALDAGDKAFIAKRLESEGWKLPDIAKLLQMRIESLEKIYVSRIQKVKITKAVKLTPESRSSREIGEYRYGFLKAPFADAGMAGTSLGQKALKVQGAVNDRGVIGILDSFIAILEGGVIDMADEEVAERIAKIAGLVSELPIPEPAAA